MQITVGSFGTTESTPCSELDTISDLTSSSTENKKLNIDAKKEDDEEKKMDGREREFTAAAVKRDGVSQLVYNLRSDDVDSVCRSLDGLTDLCYSDDMWQADQQAAIVAFEGCSAIMHALEKWNQNEKVQQNGCRALQSLSPVCRAQVVKLGGISYALTAMENFPASVNVQRNACGALLNTLWVTSAINAFVHQMKGVATIIRAMKAYPMDAKLQRCASWILYNVGASSKDMKAILIKEGAISAVAHAIENHVSDNDVVEYARKAAKLLIEPEQEH